MQAPRSAPRPFPSGCPTGAPGTARIRVGAVISPVACRGISPVRIVPNTLKRSGANENHHLYLARGDTIIFSRCFTTFSSELTRD